MREERVASLLEGEAVEVSVGEPWDFESPAGAGRLEGEILSAKVTPEEQSVLRDAVDLLRRIADRPDP